jgi:uncharacterized protein YneF (UPF0154 family)
MGWMTVLLVVLAVVAAVGYYFISKWMDKK